ncbi:MAG: DUF177 domain-containing protein [Kiritimatiellia bacterium]|jgi:uncharacterized metal-binding protein YceD (DUF177 family)|nr:DUF177 domain-containing protein [Kiritimatiellia bacterium]
MIRIPTTQIGEDRVCIAGEVPGELLDLQSDPVAREAGSIRYELSLEQTGEELVVRGTLEAPLRLLCSRCAQFFSTTVQVSAFLHAYEWSEHPEFLDVSADVREDILLEIPGFPLCGEACQGLCPQCGQNWNEGPCACAPREDVLSPWGTLEGLTAAPSQRQPPGSADEKRR